jgi:hypothetical protein
LLHTSSANAASRFIKAKSALSTISLIVASILGMSINGFINFSFDNLKANLAIFVP